MDRYVVGYRARQGAHFYFVSFNTLNLCELNDIAQGKQGNLKSLLHIRAGKGTRCEGNKSGLALATREEGFLALEYFPLMKKTLVNGIILLPGS